MKFRYIFMLSVICFAGCKPEIEETVRPFSIQTFLPNGDNQIKYVFDLPDNSFVIVANHRETNSTKFYKFNRDLKLIDSLVVKGQDFSKPALDDDGSFIMMGEDWDDPLGYAIAYKISYDLKLITRKEISALIPAPVNSYLYFYRLVRLKNGNYVLIYTEETYNVVQDKIVMMACKDLFTDSKLLWRIYPADHDGEWSENMIATTDGGYLICGHDHEHGNYHFLNKYDENGNRIWAVQFPSTLSSYEMWEHNNNYYYANWTHVYGVHQDGSPLIDKDHSDGTTTAFNSVFIPYKDNFYYTRTFFDSDGSWFQAIKSDPEFNILKTKKYGNRGTNTIVDFQRFLVQLTNGEFVAVATVENAGINGNNWLLQRFDAELELTE